VVERVAKDGQPILNADAQSDAQLLADVTIVPAIVWAGLWTLISVAVLLAGAWLALREGPLTPPSELSAARRSTSPHPPASPG